jgi:hypothetical protein
MTVIKRLEDIEAAKDKLISVVPVSLAEENCLAQIRKYGSAKNSWVEFDGYKELLERISTESGIPYRVLIRSRRKEISEALSIAFDGIKPQKEAGVNNSYTMFGFPKEKVMRAMKSGLFGMAGDVLQTNFNTYML